MLRSNSKQYGGIHVVKPEERKGKAAVGRIWKKRKIRGVSPGEEKAGYGGKICRKGKF